MLLQLSGIAFAILTGIVILFQALLAAGMPWGNYAMGGKFPGRLPAPMRAACLIQILILFLLAVIVLSKAELLFPAWLIFSQGAIWFVVVFSSVAAILNLITHSVRERRIWAPVSVLMLASSIIVAVS